MKGNKTEIKQTFGGNKIDLFKYLEKLLQKKVLRSDLNDTKDGP